MDWKKNSLTPGEPPAAQNWPERAIPQKSSQCVFRTSSYPLKPIYLSHKWLCAKVIVEMAMLRQVPTYEPWCLYAERGGFATFKIPRYIYPDVRAVAAFGAAVSCEEASREPSRGLPANILPILRPRSAGVKGFWMSETPGINMSARINSPL